MNTAIILAAGISKRFGGETPKQFLKINGKEIIDYSIETFKSSQLINSIIIVVSKEFIPKIITQYPDLKIIEGGKTRKESTYFGLCACHKKTKFVLIHDAARIFINPSLIKDCFTSLSKFDAVTTASKITDTIAKFNNNVIISMRNRDELISIQTPQAFHYKKLINSHKKFIGDSTDDIRIMLKNGYKCNFIIGHKNNIKITTKEDYILSSKIIKDLK